MVNLFGKKNPLFFSNTESLKEEGFDVKIWDERKIAKSYGERVPWALREVTGLISHSRFRFKRFLVIFDRKEKRTSWYSENTDRVVINLAFYPATPVFKQAVREAAEEAAEIEDSLAQMNS